MYILCQFVWDKDDTPRIYVLAHEENLNHSEKETKAVSADDRVLFKNFDHFAWMNLLKREVHTQEQSTSFQSVSQDG